MYCTNTKCKWYAGKEDCNFTECIYEEEDEFEGMGRG